MRIPIYLYLKRIIFDLFKSETSLFQLLAQFLTLGIFSQILFYFPNIDAMILLILYLLFNLIFTRAFIFLDKQKLLNNAIPTHYRIKPDEPFVENTNKLNVKQLFIDKNVDSVKFNNIILPNYTTIRKEE